MNHSYEPDPPSPPRNAAEDAEQLLQVLYETRKTERLESECRRFLERDPNDPVAHRFLILALLAQNRLKDARPHVDFLLGTFPDDPTSQLMAAYWYQAGRKWRKVEKHAREGMRLNPDFAPFHHLAAIADASRLGIKSARVHINRARSLDPNDGDIANLAIRLGAIDDTTVDQAMDQIQAYEDSLRSDPENPALHEGLGDVYLDSLDQPAEAEKHYREALRLDPRNPDFQRSLFAAVAKRSILYRLISLPSRAFQWLRNVLFVIAKRPWYLLLVFILFKATLTFLGWLVAATIVFWPACKIYEWLLVSEIRNHSQASLAKLRAWHWLQRKPVVARVTLFALLILIGWAAAFWSLGIPLDEGFTFLSVFVGVHLFLVTTFFVVRKIRVRLGQRRRRRKKDTRDQTAG